jgi:hypothetical protein
MTDQDIRCNLRELMSYSEMEFALMIGKEFQSVILNLTVVDCSQASSKGVGW